MSALCPHCRAKVDLANVKRETDIKEDAIETLYSCPQCRCVLGFSFMG